MNLAERQTAREAFRRFAAPAPKVDVGRTGDMLLTRFDKQRAVIASPARRKAVRCTRRAGKTETVAAYLLKTAQEHPDCIVVFVGPTLGRARELMWKPLKRFNTEYGFNGRPHESLHTLYMPNGAEIRLTGADKLKDAEKKRGDKMALVVIDEASVYDQDVLLNLIDDVFGPALEDVQGTICVMGTPGVVCAGKWYEMTRNEPEQREKGWEFFSWGVLDNPFMEHMRARLPELKRERGWTDETPTYVREWLGRWVNDTGALVYRYSEAINSYDGRLPPGHSWTHVMGVDLGFDDAFAYCVWAFSPTCLECFEVDSFSESGLTPTRWADIIKEVHERYHPVTTRVDTGGLGKAFVADFNERNRSFSLEPAEKKEKLGNIELLNDDLRCGRLRVRKTGPLASEWRRLPKDPEEPTKEDSRFPNHVSDAALYGWRATQHYLSERPTVGPKAGSPEAIAAEEQRIERELEARAMARQLREGGGDDMGMRGGLDWDSSSWGAE